MDCLLARGALKSFLGTALLTTFVEQPINNSPVVASRGLYDTAPLSKIWFYILAPAVLVILRLVERTALFLFGAFQLLWSQQGHADHALTLTSAL